MNVTLPPKITPPDPETPREAIKRQALREALKREAPPEPPKRQAVRQVQREVLTRRQMSLLAVGAFVLVLITWQAGALDGLLYPLRLFVSLIHELGHGLTAILTGGRFEGFVVYPNGSGLARLRGGNPLLTPQMGYLGAGFFGAALLVLANRVRPVRFVAYGLAVLIGGCVLIFTNSGGILIPLLIVSAIAWSVSGSVRRYRALILVAAAVCALLALAIAWTDTTLRISLISALLLAALGTFGVRPLIVFVLNFLALMVGLNALMDIWFLFGDLGASVQGYPNDAAAMAHLTGVPTLFWVTLWVALVVSMMVTAAYIAFIRPLRRIVGL